MSDTAHQQGSTAAAQEQPELWSERAIAVVSRLYPRLARTEIDLLVTLGIFSGVGVLSSLLLLILDHQLNGQLPSL